MSTVKALVLLSGGLDSILAAKVLKEEGIEVVGLTFVSNFFGAEKSREAVKKIGIDLIEYDFKKEHLKIVKEPKHGHGKNMNPCIDCHGLMVKTAFKIMREKGFDFIATGEVLGQRPKSQNKSALNLVEKYGELDGYLLRPLSAKLLPETKMEREGLVNRKNLLGIEGRNREAQTKLAKKYGIKDYPSPGGGCILTYSEYSEKLKAMFDNWPDCGSNDIELLRVGRIFWMGKTLIVIGRHKEDNIKIEKLAKKDDILFELEEKNGPISLLRAKNNAKYHKSAKIEVEIPEELKKEKEIRVKDDLIKKVAQMTGYFSPKLRGKKVVINLKHI